MILLLVFMVRSLPQRTAKIILQARFPPASYNCRASDLPHTRSA